MNIKALLGMTFVISVLCFGVMLILVHEFAIGGISARGLAAGIALLFVGIFVGFVTFAKSKSLQKAIFPTADASSPSPNGTLLFLWLARVAVVLLVLTFLTGLLHVTEYPVAPRVVGLAANLLVTYAVVTAIRKMQRGFK